MSAHGRNAGAMEIGPSSSNTAARGAASVMSTTSRRSASTAWWVTPSAGCETHGDGSSGTSARRVEAQLSFALISFVFSCLRLVLLCRSCIKTYIICVCDVEVMCRISIWHDQSFIIYIGLPKFGHAKVLARNFGTHFSLISVLYSNLKGIIHFHNRTIHQWSTLHAVSWSSSHVWDPHVNLVEQNACKEGASW